MITLIAYFNKTNKQIKRLHLTSQLWDVGIAMEDGTYFKSSAMIYNLWTASLHIMQRKLWMQEVLQHNSYRTIRGQSISEDIQKSEGKFWLHGRSKCEFLHCNRELTSRRIVRLRTRTTTTQTQL